MKTLVLLSQKGGCGKTTIAVHLAVAAAESGETVAVVDTDPQESATVWSRNRATETPVVVQGVPTEIKRIAEAAEADGITLLIVDTAPHATAEAAQVVREADMVLIPVRPTAFDIAAAGAAVSIARASGSMTAFILSACPFRAPEIDETRTILAEYGLPIAPQEVTDRRAYARAVASGKAVTEFEGEGKAAEEIRSLWRWIKEQIKDERDAKQQEVRPGRVRSKVSGGARPAAGYPHPR